MGYIISNSQGYLSRGLEWTEDLDLACRGSLEEITRTVQNLGLKNYEIKRCGMLVSEKLELYRELKDKYGMTMQTVVAIEELSELQKELTKTLRSKGNKNDLIEEIADVEIMIEQLKHYFDVYLEVEQQKEVKLERTKRRMAEC